ncbi:MAG: DM13 domain-containing protein [Salibacteraceae bacterium]
MKKNALIAVVLLATLFSGCIGTDVIDDLGNVDPRLELIGTNVRPLDTILVGGDLQYSSRFIDATNTVVSVGITWESSDPSIATVSADGLAQGVKGGVTVITGSYQGLIQQRVLIVEAIERIETAASAGLVNGSSIQVAATYFDAQNNPATANFTWTSADPSIVSVDAAGLVTGLAVGQTTIMASFNGINSRLIWISVVNNAADFATIEPSVNSKIIQMGEPVNFSAQGFRADMGLQNNLNFTWQSTPTSVLQVSNDGTGTPVQPGYAEVVASANGIQSPPLSVIVVPPAITSRTGSFTGINNYDVSGDVTLERDSDGRLVLKFASNFQTDNGPGLYIYLSNSTTGGQSIVKLPQISGEFDVVLPENIGIKDFNYVLVWCEPFGATFGHALLN